MDEERRAYERRAWSEKRVKEQNIVGREENAVVERIGRKTAGRSARRTEIDSESR
jgi:hypothetical protein